MLLVARPNAHVLLLPAPGPPPQPGAEDLPLEVARTILEHLQTPRDIAAARGVCRRWRLIVDDSSIIWRGIAFESIPRRSSAAAKFYRRAAASGNAKASFLLALLYSYGYRGDE